MDIYIGCSGWYYDHWVGTFYPRDLGKAGWLPYYAQHFTIVEINATFYRLPTRQTVERWHSVTPDDFRFVVKGSQSITHNRQLVDIGPDLELLNDRIAPLGQKLKAILWQFPPSYRKTRASFEALERFCRDLVRLERKSVFEFRDASWLQTDTAELLQASGFDFVTADHPGFYLERPVPQTGDTRYIRLHGLEGDHATRYLDAQMDALAADISNRPGSPLFRDVLVLFNNDITTSAIFNAKYLQDRLEALLPGRQPGLRLGLVQPMLPGF